MQSDFKGEVDFNKKTKNLTIYGPIGEAKSLLITSEEIKFFEQIGENLVDNLMPKFGLNVYENIDFQAHYYGLKIEYELTNCSKWEYFKKQSVEEKS